MYVSERELREKGHWIANQSNWQRLVRFVRFDLGYARRGCFQHHEGILAFSNHQSRKKEQLRSDVRRFTKRLIASGYKPKKRRVTELDQMWLVVIEPPIDVEPKVA